MESSIKFPYKISKFEENEKYTGQPEGFVQVGPERFVLFAGYKDFADTVYNLKVRSDDVFVCTHPRSGTTWTQEIVWLICNDLDYETASTEVLDKRFPYLEYEFIDIVSMFPFNNTTYFQGDTFGPMILMSSLRQIYSTTRI